MTFIAVPFPDDTPPHKPVYHCHIAPVPEIPPVSVRVIVPPVHIVDEGVAVTEAGIADKVFTIIVVLTHEVELQAPTEPA